MLSLKMTSRILRTSLSNSVIGKKEFHASSNLASVMEFDKKGGYPKIYDRSPKESKQSLVQKVVNGFKIFRNELKLLFNEVRENLSPDSLWPVEGGDSKIIWRFNESPEACHKWVVTSDSDYNQGYSKATFEPSPHGTAIFSGTLNTTRPRDGRTKRAGYCNITSQQPQKAFFRKANLNWEHYTHLVLRVRGDGRCYMINLLAQGMFDLQWNDCYHYMLHTRGGPYWQYTKIPFSKFVFSSKGWIQDKPEIVRLRDLTRFGITIGDTIPGSFKLEIDYIGVEKDEFAFEETAYETYRITDVKW